MIELSAEEAENIHNVKDDFHYGNKYGPTLFSRIKYASGWQLGELVNSLESDIHNNKSSPKHRPQIHKLIQYMRKKGFTTIKELILSLQDKFNQ
jgi:hypothetical protein